MNKIYYVKTILSINSEAKIQFLIVNLVIYLRVYKKIRSAKEN